MPGQLTKTGYAKLTAEEVRDDLISKIKLRIPEFTLQPADLQSDLINTSIEDILQYEDMTETMLNAIAPGYANDEIFKKFAESIGLSNNVKFNSSVVLTFNGIPATFIPKGTVCSGGGHSVRTTKDVLLSSTGSKTVLAETTDVVVIPANTITSIDSANIPGLTVTNEVEGIAGIEQESLEQLKYRAQARFRSPRKGGIDYTYSIVTTNLKVDPRLVRFRLIDRIVYNDGNSTSTKYVMSGVEAIIGGGSDEDVALALFQGFIETQKLVSQPSDNDTSRTVSINIGYYGNTIPIKFTRPKSLNLDITLMISFTEIQTTPTSIKGATEDELTNYINTLALGSPLSKLTLTSIILPLLQAKGIATNTIASIDYELKINGNVITTKGPEGFIKEVQFDTYLILTSYNVEIVTTGLI